MAAPSIIGSPRHDSRLDRIQVDVAEHCQQVPVRVYQRRMISLLEKVTRRSKAFLHLPGVAAGKTQHQSPERLVADLDQEVYMIRHQAIAMEPRSEAVDGNGHVFGEKGSIPDCEENVLLVIAAQRHVIERSGYMDSGSACHPWLRFGNANGHVIASG
jgi:hypothetical protein